MIRCAVGMSSRHCAGPEFGVTPVITIAYSPMSGGGVCTSTIRRRRRLHRAGPGRTIGDGFRPGSGHLGQGVWSPGSTHV